MSRFSVHDNNVNINDRRPVSSRSLAKPWAPCSSFYLSITPPAPSSHLVATCMIFRLGVRTCESRSRAFIICFYARLPEEGPANTWMARCHPRGSYTIGNGWIARKGSEGRSREKEKEKEKGGRELSERNNISPKDLFTWRERPTVAVGLSQSGSLPRESFSSTSSR